MNTPANSRLTIGRAAKLAGVGVDTIRFYEQRGLLPEPERTGSGYRLYGRDTIERLNFIRRAKTLGFSLEEISTLLDLQDNGGPKAEVKAITSRKLQQIDARIADLQRIRTVLQSLNHECSGRGSVHGCPIIETLADSEEVLP